LGDRHSACVICLGCPKNQVDSEHVLGSLALAGFAITADAKSADLVVITTCAFLQSAVHESESVIEETLHLKEHRPGLQVVVAGCLVQRYGAELGRRFPGVDLWTGLDGIEDIPRLLRMRAHVFTCAEPHHLPKSGTPRILSTPGHFAYLKIADGCDNRCHYCMIPDIRGHLRSRLLPDIVAEARALVKDGVRELILVAQDTTLYGTDFRNPKAGFHHQACPERGRRDTKTQRRIPIPAGLGGEPQLARLLNELGKIVGLRWIRLMYTHPAHLTEEVIDQFGTNPKLCRYVDLPIQHVSDRLLDRMNRPYTRADVELLLESLRAVPDMHIRTTIIVGYPGETSRDFAELLEFVRTARIDRLSAYAWSPEPGTPAEKMPGRVSPAVKKERIRRLMQTQAAVSRANLKKLVGRELTVLVDALTADTESHHKDTKTPSPGSGNRHSSFVIRHSSAAISGLGRTEWDAPEIDGVVKLTGKPAKPGCFVRALVTASSTHDLTARVVSAAV
jgi:ribosomal protein S12 methylthiotransferase